MIILKWMIVINHLLIIYIACNWSLIRLNMQSTDKIKFKCERKSYTHIYIFWSGRVI